jgi:hypothetical protein
MLEYILSKIPKNHFVSGKEDGSSRKYLMKGCNNLFLLFTLYGLSMAVFYHDYRSFFGP